MRVQSQFKQNDMLVRYSGDVTKDFSGSYHVSDLKIVTYGVMDFSLVMDSALQNQNMGLPGSGPVVATLQEFESKILAMEDGSVLKGSLITVFMNLEQEEPAHQVSLIPVVEIVEGPREIIDTGDDTY